ncbi:MAG: GNAT family N-acetyltransferase [Pseudonocardiales bacterium]
MRRLQVHDEYEQAIALITEGPDADASLFCAAALRNRPHPLRVYGEWEGDELRGLLALLPSLPPFAVPVMLPAGDVTDALLNHTAAHEPSPHMALGASSVNNVIAARWPRRWFPLIGVRSEVLLRQRFPYRMVERVDLSTRLAREPDIDQLVEYRRSMERDSDTTIVSSPAEARAISIELVAAQALTVVEVGGEVAGCAAVTTGDDQHAQLGFVYVEPRYRLTGVSDRLLADICLAIHDRGTIPIAFTDPDGPLANRLRVLGFEHVGYHSKLYFGQPSTALR